MYYVEVYRDGRWTLVGQYPDRASAKKIAADYRTLGEKARVTTDGTVEVR